MWVHLAGRDHPPGLDHRRAVALGVADHQAAINLVRKRAETVSLGQGESKRDLTENMLSSPQRPLDLLGMGR